MHVVVETADAFQILSRAHTPLLDREVYLVCAFREMRMDRRIERMRHLVHPQP